MTKVQIKKNKSRRKNKRRKKNSGTISIDLFGLAGLAAYYLLSKFRDKNYIFKCPVCGKLDCKLHARVEQDNSKPLMLKENNGNS